MISKVLPREIPAKEAQRRGVYAKASREGTSGLLHAREVHINGIHGRDSLQFKTAVYDQLLEAFGKSGIDLLTQPFMREAGSNAQRLADSAYAVLSTAWGHDADVEKAGTDSSPLGAAAPSISQEIPTLNAKEAIDAFLEEREFRNCSPKTIGNYSHFLRRFIGRFSHVPTDHRMIRQLLSKYKGKTKETYWLYFSAFYGFLEKEYGLPNPLARLPAPHEPRRVPSHLNPEQKARLAEIKLNPRDRALVNLFCESALRPGEILDSHGHPLRFCDIHEDHIRVSGKRGERIVPITPQTRDRLLQLQGSRPADSAVFTRDDGHALTYWGLRKIVDTAFKKAGITGVKVCPYTLRHSFAGDFLARGGDLATLQKILGHANVKTTMIYTHIADQQVMDSYRRHGPSAINCSLIALEADASADPKAETLVTGGKFPVNSDPAQQLPDLLDRLIALGQLAQEIKHSLGGNGHRPEQLKELIHCLKHQA